MARYWLGPWEWTGAAWTMPSGSVSALDLRSVAQCAQAVTPSGLALFVTPDAANLGSSYENLGTNPLANWNQQAKNRWRSALALPNTLTANNLRQAVWETLTLQADPIGDDRCLPLIPTTTRRFEVWLAGQLADSKQFDIGGFESPPMLDVLKRIYRRMRQASLDGQMPATQYRKWLGFQVRKYGIDYHNFQPADVPDEEPLPPETTITETFNDTNGQPLGPNHTWVMDNHGSANTWQCNSNRADKTATHAEAQLTRADSALSSDDHYSQANVYGTANDYLGPACRMPNSQARTGYVTQVDASLQYLTKFVAGTQTNFHSASNSWADGVLLKVEADGSTIKGYEDGAQVLSTTDTAITGNLYCGLQAFSASGDMDNFEAADLGGGGATVPIFRRHYQLMQTR